MQGRRTNADQPSLVQTAPAGAPAPAAPPTTENVTVDDFGRVISTTPSAPTAPPASAATTRPSATPPARAVTSSSGGRRDLDPAATQAPAPAQTPTQPRSTLNDAQTAQAIKAILGGNPNPNILNTFRQVNYHFRLFMTQDLDPWDYAKTHGSAPEDAADLYQAIAGMPQVTLAETGKTAYNIRSVEINSFTGPNSTTRMLDLTDITITITEPMGLAFAETLVAAAKKLNVLNYSKHFFYLELSFIGYKEDGSFEPSPCAGLNLKTGSTWLWQISITTIDTHLDAGGGTYTIHALPYEQANALDRSVYMVPATIKASGGTLKAFTDSLAIELNKSWQKRYGNDVITYAFKWEPFPEMEKVRAIVGDNPDPGAIEITSQDGPLNSFRQASMETLNGAHTITLQTGVSLDKFLEGVIGSTEKGQQLAKDNPSISETKSVDPKKPKYSTVFRVEVDTQLTSKFEVISQQYYRVVTFHIRPYTTLAPIIDPDQTKNALDPAVSWQGAKHLIDNGLLKKHYDYLFTGMNTEIIDFDVKYSFIWNAELPKAQGINRSDENVAPGQRISANSPGASAVAARNELIRQIKADGRSYTTLSNTVQQADTLLAEINSGTLSAADLARKTQALGAVIGPNSGLADLVQQRNSLAAQRDALNTKIVTATRNAAASTSELEAQAGKTFAEVLLQQTATKTAEKAQGEPRALPISFVQSYRDLDDEAKTGSTAQQHRDRSVFACVLGQLYQQDAETFSKISMTVRGDPFWLGSTNLGRLITLRSNQPPQPVATNLPDFQRGDNCLVLRFRAPLRPGDDFVPEFHDSLVFNGIYRVTQVRHSFVDGGFKQTLEGYRLALINILEAYNYSPSASDFSATHSAIASTGAPTKPAPGANVPRLPYTSPSEGTPSYQAGNKASYIAAMTPYAQEASARTGVSPEIILAQSGIETGWGAHAPNNNYFGIKGNGPGSAVQTTREVVNGQTVTIPASFSGYSSAQDSYRGYADFINANPRYAALRAAGRTGDLAAQAAALQASKYASNPNYGSDVLATARTIKL